MARRAALLLALVAAGCGGSSVPANAPQGPSAPSTPSAPSAPGGIGGDVQLGAGSDGASASASAEGPTYDPYAASLAEAYMQTSGDGASGHVDGSLAPGRMRLKPSVCDGMKELRPEYKTLREDAVIEFLKTQGVELTRKEKARADLVYYWVTFEGKPVRLRVAILPSAQEAGRELHEAILQHGAGSSGVHRSNLAVLFPIGDPDQVIAFAVKTKLACWGVLTMAGRDDDFVVPGGYTEL